MEELIPQTAKFQLLDNYISNFSLETSRKIMPNEPINADINIAFRIVNIEHEKKVGQIELKYDILIMKVKEDNEGENEKEELGKIKIVSNALFKGDKSIEETDFERMLKINGATTLSHINRAYINSATSLSGMPSIMIPLIDFNEFFENAKTDN